MSGYFGHSAFPIFTLSRWVRYWLMLRLYRSNYAVVDGKRYLTRPLTRGEKAVIFAVHLVILGATVAASVLIFLGISKLIYA